MNAYDFFHKHFDVEYWVNTGFRIRKKDNITELFLSIESEGKILEMIHELDEGAL